MTRYNIDTGAFINGIILSALLTMILFSTFSQTEKGKLESLFYIMVFIMLNIFFHLGRLWEKEREKKVKEKIDGTEKIDRTLKT